jgi:hypothetical protein
LSPTCLVLTCKSLVLRLVTKIDRHFDIIIIIVVIFIITTTHPLKFSSQNKRSTMSYNFCINKRKRDDLDLDDDSSSQELFWSHDGDVMMENDDDDSTIKSDFKIRVISKLLTSDSSSNHHPNDDDANEDDSVGISSKGDITVKEWGTFHVHKCKFERMSELVRNFFDHDDDDDVDDNDDEDDHHQAGRHIMDVCLHEIVAAQFSTFVDVIYAEGNICFRRSLFGCETEQQRKRRRSQTITATSKSDIDSSDGDAPSTTPILITQHNCIPLFSCARFFGVDNLLMREQQVISKIVAIHGAHICWAHAYKLNMNLDTKPPSSPPPFSLSLQHFIKTAAPTTPATASSHTEGRRRYQQPVVVDVQKIILQTVIDNKHSWPLTSDFREELFKYINTIKSDNDNDNNGGGEEEEGKKNPNKLAEMGPYDVVWFQRQFETWKLTNKLADDVRHENINSSMCSVISHHLIS